MTFDENELSLEVLDEVDGGSVWRWIAAFTIGTAVRSYPSPAYGDQPSVGGIEGYQYGDEYGY